MNRHYILQSTIVLFLFIALSLPICAQSDEQKVNILLSEENYGQAITLLNSLISKDSSNARLFYKLGAAYYGAYKFASSLKPLLNAIKLDSLSSSYYYLLSKSTSSLGYNSEALKAARKAYSLDSMNLNIIFNLAGLLVGNKNYIEAAAYYGKAILADSTNSFAYSQAGHCWLKCNSIDLSVLYYKKALEYNPMDLNSAQQLAINYIFLNRITDALASADSSIKYWPNEAVFRKLKGEAYFKAKMYKPAYENFAQCALLGDNSASLFQRLGFSYFYYASTNDSIPINEKMIFYEEAKMAFEESLKREENNPVTCYYLGYMHEKTLQMDKALEFYRQALKLSQNDLTADIYTRMGDCYNFTKLYEEAVDAYKKSITLKPDNSVVLNNIGYVLFTKLGRNDELLDFFKNLMKHNQELNPDLKKFISEKIASMEKGEKKSKP